MTFRKRAAMAALALCMAGPAPAALVYDYELNSGDPANAVGGLDIVTEGGTIGATGYTFGPNEGLAITNATISGVYTIDFAFTLRDLDSWKKIIDFKNLIPDDGLYVYNGFLNFYPLNVGTTPFTVGQMSTVRITRDAAGLVSTYVNGGFEFSFDDSGSQYGVFDPGVMEFFHDDADTGFGEAAGGFVDYIRVYDEALGGAVPEPASWAMMIAGFGLVGGALRRRGTAVRFA